MIDCFASFTEWLRTNGWLTDWLVLLVAVVTAWFALSQLRQARKVQDEQARPYVVAGIRRPTGGIVEIYVKNLGNTAAYDVHLTSEPALTSVTDPDFTMFDVIPTLVPQEEWSTIWEDYAHKRKQAGAPDRFDITMTYRGNNTTGSWINRRAKRTGPEFADLYVIDWAPFWATSFIQHKDMDDLVTSVRAIHKSIGPDKHGQRTLVQSVHSIAEALKPKLEPPSSTRKFLDRIRSRLKRRP